MQNYPQPPSARRTDFIAGLWGCCRRRYAYGNAVAVEWVLKSAPEITQNQWISMTRKHGAGESCVNRMAVEQLCAETFAKFSNRRPFQPAPARDDIKPGGLAFTALDMMQENDAPRDYEAENSKTKAKFFQTMVWQKEIRNYT